MESPIPERPEAAKAPGRNPLEAIHTSVLLGSLSFGMLGFLLPIYGKRLGASALEIGGLFTAFSIMTLVLRPLFGWAMDRYGRKPFFVAGLLAYAVAMAVFAGSASITGLYLGRIVQGVASSLLWASAYTMATELSKSGWGLAVGGVDQAMARGGLYGSLAGFAVLMQFKFVTGLHILFAAYAGLAALAAWQAWQSTPETRGSRRTRVAGPHRSQVSGLARRLAPLMAVVFLSGLASATTGPLILIFLQDHFTNSFGNIVWAYLPAALVSSYLPARLGRLSDRYGRSHLMALGLAGSGLVSLLLPWLRSLGWLAVVWALQAVGLAAASPAQEALVADLTGTEARGTGYGLYQFASSVGLVLGPLVGGWLYDARGQAFPFYLGGGLLLFATVLTLVWVGQRASGSRPASA